MNEEITVDRHDLRFVNDISWLDVLIKPSNAVVF